MSTSCVPPLAQGPRGASVPVEKELEGLSSGTCMEAPAAEHCWRSVLEFLLLSPLGIFCCFAPRGKAYLFCDDDASHYVKTNLWAGQGVVVAGLGSGLAVPANAFVPRAVLIYSLVSIVITNASSLFHCSQPRI